MKGHTPGPWFAEKGAATARRQVAELVDGRTGLALWRIVHDGQEDGDAEADARLIAAAPGQNAALGDALDALTDAEQYHSRRCAKDQPHDHALLRKLKAAIVKCEAAIAEAECHGEKL